MCACTVVFRVRVFPNANPACGDIGVAPFAVNLGIESPLLMPRFRVERNHDVRRGFEIKKPERKHGRRFEREFRIARKAVTYLAGAVRPGHRELVYVVALDLVEAGEVLAERITTIE